MPPSIKRSAIWPDPRVKPPFGSVTMDWGHPLASGLVGYWPLNEGGGATVYSLAQSLNGTRVNAPSNGGGYYGPHILFASASAQYIDCGNPAPLQITADITVHTAYTLTTVPPLVVSSMSLVAKDADLGGRAFTFDVARSDADPNSAGVRFYINGGAGNNIVVEGRNPVVGDTRTCTGSYRTGDKLLTLYVNGARVAEKTADTSGIPSATSAVRFASRSYMGFEDPLNGSMPFVMIWNRKLSDAEVNWIHAQPYSLLRPILRRRYVGSSAPTPGGGGTGLWLRRRRRRRPMYRRVA